MIVWMLKIGLKVIGRSSKITSLCIFVTGLHSTHSKIAKYRTPPYIATFDSIKCLGVTPISD